MNKPGRVPLSRRDLDDANALSLRATYERLKPSVKHGTFTKEIREHLKTIALELAAIAQPRSLLGEFWYLKTLTAVAESLAYFACSAEAHRLFLARPDQASRLPLSIASSASEDERELIRERIRYCLVQARVTEQMTGRHDEAKVAFAKYLELLEALPTEMLPCNATRAQAYFYLGEARARLGEATAAVKSYERALTLYQQRGQQRLSESEPDPLELGFVRHRCAVVLTGLARVAHSTGALGRALSFIAPAQVLVLRRNDPLNGAALDLLYGAVLHDMTPADHVQNRVIAAQMLLRARRAFQRFAHVPGLTRTAFELARVYALLPRKKANAARYLSAAESSARGANDRRWIAYCLCRRSRLANVNEALRLADEALRMATGPHLVSCQIDAWIAKAEAYLRTEATQPDGVREAAAALHKVTRLGAAKNPRLEATCALLRAQSYLKQEMPENVTSALNDAARLLADVEDADLHETFARLRADRAAFERSQLLLDLSTRDYRALESQLRRSLLGVVRDVATERERADVLHISRTMLRRWEREFPDLTYRGRKRGRRRRPPVGKV
jgi:tetratricopeptide (TPR) repeat protein